MNLRDIQTWYDHHCWAAGKIFDAAGKISQEQLDAQTPASSYGSLRGTLIHMLDAETSYRTRMAEGVNPPDLPDSDFPTVGALAAYFKGEQAKMRAYMATLKDEDLEGVAVYEAGGAERRRPRWHIWTQLFGHGTQHRAETAVMLTELGQSPGDLDFVVWVDTNGQS